jgi:hypothetical protein
MGRWFWVLAAVLSAAAVFLLVTGGDSSSDDEAQIEASLVRMLTVQDPANCDDLLSEEWLATHFDSSTQTPLERCYEANSEEEKATSADVTDVSVSGTTGRATVYVTGGDIGEATMELAMIKDGGWRSDRLLSLDVDVEKYFAASSTNRPSGAFGRCLYDWARSNVTSEQLEAGVISGSHDYLLGAWPACQVAFETSMISADLFHSNGGLELEDANCVAARMRRFTTDASMHEVFESTLIENVIPQEFLTARDAAVAQCLGA